MPPFRASHRVQAAIATVAERQHGVITSVQLRRCGLGPSGPRDWIRAGRLHRLHRGVYAVGHRALSHEGRWMAAVLALGEGAVLSHRSAAMLWEMLKPTPGAVHVMVPGNSGRSRRAGLVIHRSSTLNAGATTNRNNIALTGPARTLSDLRRSGSRAEHRRALRQAEYLRQTGRLRFSTAELPEADGTRSGLEQRFLAFCRRHRLPRPEVSASLGPYTADFLWREQRVIVETDSFRTHGGPVAFEEDRERDLWFAAHGFTTVRVTDQRLDRDPAGEAVSLRATLER